MCNTNDLSTAITGLRRCSEMLLSVSDTLATMLNSQGSEQPEESAPATEPITLEQVRAVLAEKSVQGQTAEVQALIHTRGVEKLSQVNPAEYAGLIAEAEAM